MFIDTCHETILKQQVSAGASSSRLDCSSHPNLLKPSASLSLLPSNLITFSCCVLRLLTDELFETHHRPDFLEKAKVLRLQNQSATS